MAILVAQKGSEGLCGDKETEAEDRFPWSYINLASFWQPTHAFRAQFGVLLPACECQLCEGEVLTLRRVRAPGCGSLPAPYEPFGLWCYSAKTEPSQRSLHDSGTRLPAGISTFLVPGSNGSTPYVRTCLQETVWGWSYTTPMGNTVMMVITLKWSPTFTMFKMVEIEMQKISPVEKEDSDFHSHPTLNQIVLNQVRTVCIYT